MIANALFAPVTRIPMAVPEVPRRRRRRVDADVPDTPVTPPIPAATPSKTQRKAAMHELQDLGAALTALDERRLAEVAAVAALPERLVEAIAAARTITAWGARKRQLQYVGKLMRDVDATSIRRQLDAWAHGRATDAARQHALEALRDELLADPAALDALAAAHPGLDRARFAALVARARAERADGGPPHAYRELFRALKALA